jgi:plasmid stabilization system protein ParE
VTIKFAPQAEADFAAPIGFLAERNPDAAEDLGRRLFDIVDKLARADFEGPELLLMSGERVRSWPVPPVRRQRLMIEPIAK